MFNIFKYTKIMMIVFSIVTISGCAPNLNFVPSDIPIKNTQIDVNLDNISVAIPHKDERHGKVQTWNTKPNFIPAIQHSLEEALTRAAIFNNASGKKATLFVKILQVHRSFFTLYKYKTKTIISYEMIERSTGKILFSKTILSNVGIPFSFSIFSPSKTTYKAWNLSIKANIEQFIAEIGESGLQN